MIIDSYYGLSFINIKIFIYLIYCIFDFKNRFNFVIIIRKLKNWYFIIRKAHKKGVIIFVYPEPILIIIRKLYGGICS